MKLWYRTPACEWLEALPIANGHMGAMCWGNAEGRFDLSESTCWAGAPCDPLKEHAAESMAEARKLLLASRYEEADKLLEQTESEKKNFGTQLPLGRLFVGLPSDEAASCYRELDLRTGIACEKLQCGGSKICRESFVSNPDKVMAVHLTAEKPVPAFRLWLEGWSQPALTQWEEQNGILHVRGRALELMHSDGLSGVSYHMILKYDTDGTAVQARTGLEIQNASRLTVYLTAASDMFDENPEETCRIRVEKAWNKGLDAIRADHAAEHSAGMEQCSFSMPDAHAELPTDERIRRFTENKGGDNGLIALFFQFGRYVIFNTSRPDSLLPAALQGIWNDDRACRMEWTDDMHLDINTQMNYYPAENTGLGDCTLPLFRWIKERLMPCGKEIAKNLYGAEGWCAHTVANAFGWAAPGWGYRWGIAPSCGGWIATHIWEHYQYTGDRDFLAEYYEVLYESARFFRSILMEDPETGELLVTPSYSPENVFRFEGTDHCQSAGSTFSTAVARKIFRMVRESAKILHREDAFTESLADVLAKLPPYRVGKHGQLMEWYKDFEEVHPDHRHTSHLLSMYPFNDIDPSVSPELKAAVETSLERRLGKDAKDIMYTNWAGALLILYSARLLDREKAGNFIIPMISAMSHSNLMITHQGDLIGGIYELDGNTGLTAGIGEMLLQSYNGAVHIVPAIPDSWENGEFSGMRTYGGHVVSAVWDSHTVSGTITAKTDGKILLRCYGQEQTAEAKAGEKIEFHFNRV